MVCCTVYCVVCILHSVCLCTVCLNYCVLWITRTQGQTEIIAGADVLMIFIVSLEGLSYSAHVTLHVISHVISHVTPHINPLCEKETSPNSPPCLSHTLSPAPPVSSLFPTLTCIYERKGHDKIRQNRFKHPSPSKEKKKGRIDNLFVSFVVRCVNLVACNRSLSATCSMSCSVPPPTAPGNHFLGSSR